MRRCSMWPRRLALEVDDICVALHNQHLAEMEIAVHARSQRARALRRKMAHRLPQGPCSRPTAPFAIAPVVRSGHSRAARSIANAPSSCSIAPSAHGSRSIVGFLGSEIRDHRSVAESSFVQLAEPTPDRAANAL